MPAQEIKNGAPQEPTTVGDVAASATSLAHDLITLAELQARLVYVDVREAGTRSAASAVSLAAMLGLILSAAPVGLLGLSEWIAGVARWNPGLTKLFVGGIAVLLGMAFGFVCFQRLRRVMKVFSRTQQELQQNLDFVKSLVSDPPPSDHRSFSRRW